MTLRDVGINFTRNRSDAMQTKAQTLEILLRCGINPEDAIEFSEMFNDPSAVYKKSVEGIEKALGQSAISENPEASVPPAQAEDI